MLCLLTRGKSNCCVFIIYYAIHTLFRILMQKYDNFFIKTRKMQYFICIHL